MHRHRLLEVCKLQEWPSTNDISRYYASVGQLTSTGLHPKMWQVNIYIYVLPKPSSGKMSSLQLIMAEGQFYCTAMKYDGIALQL